MWEQAVITEQRRRADMATATAGLPADLQADMEAAGRARAAEAAAAALARSDQLLATHRGNAAEAARTDAPTVPDDATTVEVDGQAAAQQTLVDETARRHAQILTDRDAIRGMSEDDLLGLEAHYSRSRQIIPGPPLGRQMVVAELNQRANEQETAAPSASTRRRGVTRSPSPGHRSDGGRGRRHRRRCRLGHR